MRKMLVRGQRVDNKKWVCGSYVYYEHCPHHCIYVNEDIGGDGYIEPKYCLQNYEVIPETVGRYLMLPDINNANICEGDVVNCPNLECFGVIKYNEDEASFFFNIVYEGGMLEEEFISDYLSDMEIIGNIHDNPELLEV